MSDICRYTVVVSSCDAYSDLWDPFFKVLRAEWPQLESEQIPIILNTEHKGYIFDGLNIRTLKIYREGEKPSWTERLKRTLESIDTDYIVFLLDDFFMQKMVRADRLDQCVKWMDADRKVSVFCFKETFVSKNIRNKKYEGFEKRPLFGQYKFNCQAAIWRRDRLISYLKHNENPWEWETMGNWRSYRCPSHHFYSQIPSEDRVFPYINEINGVAFGGSAIFRGKWYVPSVEQIFKKHGISIDYSIRGTVSANDFVPIKSRDDASVWKRRMWFVRPVYCKAKTFLNKFIFVICHFWHFF